MIVPVKTIEAHFIDWESEAFGYGYGSGEPHIIPALQQFFLLCNKEKDGLVTYNYRELESTLTPAVAWLLINALCKARVIEYGTSPRCGWLLENGEQLKEFVVDHTPEELIDIVMSRQDGYVHCYSDTCWCGPEEQDGKFCLNPFWNS